MPRPRKDKNQGPRLSLNLQVTQPVKVDDVWEVKAVSTVLYGSRAPEPPREIVFVVDGAEYERVMTDFDSGMAITSSPMFFRETGEHIITVYVSDFLSLRRYHRFMIKEEKKLTEDDKKIASIKTKTDLAKAEKELREATPPEGRHSLKIVKYFQQPFTTEVFVRRLGLDGKPETGEIKAWYFKKETGETLFVDPLVSTPHIPAMFSVSDFWEEIKEVTFFLPDHPEVEVIFKVPARNVEEPKETAEVKSAGRRISEAWQRGRRGELLAAKDPAKVLPLAVVVGGVAATVLAFRGPEGPGGK